jgi:hypothetical protein
MVQFGHEKTSQSPMPRALSRKEPAEHRIVIEGAGEHLSGAVSPRPATRISRPATHTSVGRAGFHGSPAKPRTDSRKTLGFMTPSEKLAELLAHTG